MIALAAAACGGDDLTCELLADADNCGPDYETGFDTPDTAAPYPGREPVRITRRHPPTSDKLNPEICSRSVAK